MRIQQPDVLKCDLCLSTVQDLHKVNCPVKVTGTDGSGLPITKQEQEKFEICDDCLKKVTRVIGNSTDGNVTYSLKLSS